MTPGSPGYLGLVFSRIFSVAFLIEQYSEADSLPTSSPVQYRPQMFDWIEALRVGRPFLLPQKLTAGGPGGVDLNVPVLLFQTFLLDLFIFGFGFYR